MKNSLLDKTKQLTDTAAKRKFLRWLRENNLPYVLEDTGLFFLVLHAAGLIITICVALSDGSRLAAILTCLAPFISVIALLLIISSLALIIFIVIYHLHRKVKDFVKSNYQRFYKRQSIGMRNKSPS